MNLTFDRVLVTGGSGFIGSHTVDALIKANIESWVLDNLSTGTRRNLCQHKQNRRLHFVKGSICNVKAVDSLARRVDAIVHLAAVVNPFLSIHHPEVTNNVNVTGTVNLLRAASKHHVQRIVFASSSSVYGEIGKQARIDENTATNPITPYGASKLAGEKYCRAFCVTFGTSAISLRYFNVYGERQRDNPYSGVIAIFANKILRSQKPIIYGDGNQTRDFIHVADVARANLAALANTHGEGEAFNIGTGTPTSINALYALISRIVSKPNVNPVRKPERKGDIRHSCADVRRAERALRFSSTIPLETGLFRLVSSLARDVSADNKSRS